MGLDVPAAALLTLSRQQPLVHWLCLPPGRVACREDRRPRGQSPPLPQTADLPPLPGARVRLYLSSRLKGRANLYCNHPPHRSPAYLDHSAPCEVSRARDQSLPWLGHLPGGGPLAFPPSAGFTVGNRDRRLTEVDLSLQAYFTPRFGLLAVQHENRDADLGYTDNSGHTLPV